MALGQNCGASHCIVRDAFAGCGIISASSFALRGCGKTPRPEGLWRDWPFHDPCDGPIMIVETGNRDNSRVALGIASES
jgi:hypothetical protein